MERKRLAVLLAGLTVLAVAAVGVTAGLGADDPAPASTQPAQPSERTIAVDATGEAAAAPDAAIVRVAVTAEGDNQSAVRDDLAADASALRTALDDLGVDYETTDYRLDRTPRSEERNMPEYRGVTTYTVRLNDPDRAGTVADAAVDAGASVRSIDLTLAEETRQQLRDDAIEDALDDARGQAATIANATDLAVVGVLTVDATQEEFSPVSYDAAATVEQAGGSATQITPGDVTVTYDVRVTYGAAATGGASGSSSGSSSGSGN